MRTILQIVLERAVNTLRSCTVHVDNITFYCPTNARNEVI